MSTHYVWLEPASGILSESVRQQVLDLEIRGAYRNGASRVVVLAEPPNRKWHIGPRLTP